MLQAIMFTMLMHSTVYVHHDTVTYVPYGVTVELPMRTSIVVDGQMHRVDLVVQGVGGGYITL